MKQNKPYIRLWAVIDRKGRFISELCGYVYCPNADMHNSAVHIFLCEEYLEEFDDL